MCCMGRGQRQPDHLRSSVGHGQGTWKARTAKGQSFSGSWQADLPESKDQTFALLLQRTVEKEVAGFWHSGGYQGNWWLTGLKHKNGKR